MNNRKVYAAPKAEVILLAPSEGIATWDSEFKNLWEHGYKAAFEGTASAVGIINGAGGSLTGDIWQDDGFVIKKTS